MQASTLHLERQIQIGDMPLHEARAQWAQWRTQYGFKLDATALLTAPTGNLKLGLSAAPTYGLTLSAASNAGINVCLWSTASCRAACVLTTSFRGRDAKNIRAREAKTTFFDAAPVAFLTLLNDEIHKAVKKWSAVKVRLNVASDIRFEAVAPWLFETADPYGVVVGLAAKAGARGDKTGFVKPGIAS
jgi:hypothetical protein